LRPSTPRRVAARDFQRIAAAALGDRSARAADFGRDTRVAQKPRHALGMGD